MQRRFIIFGSIIKEIRLSDKRNFQQSDVAKKLNMSLGQYNDIENNHQSIFTSDEMEKFIELFNLTGEQKSLIYDLAIDEDEFLSELTMFMDEEPDYVEEEWKTKIRQAEAIKSAAETA